MIKRIVVNADTLLADVQDTYNTIERELVDNASELVYRSEYYTSKYRGDRLNDLNVGIFLGEGRQFVVQVYIANKTGIIKKQLKMSRDLKRISGVDEMINTFEPNMEMRVKVYDKQPFKERFANEFELLKLTSAYNSFEFSGKHIEGENIVYLIKASK